MKNINDIKEIFFDMEVSEGLFDLKLDDGAYYWDIIRREVFYEVYRAYDKSFVYRNPEKIKSKWQSGFLNIVKAIASQVNILLISLWKPEYIFITAQRLTVGSKKTDVVCDSAFNLIANKKKTLRIETCNKFGIVLFGKKKCLLNIINNTLLNEDFSLISDKISSLVFDYFNIDIILTKYIEKALIDFKNQENYYEKCFSRHQPKAVIIVQNGIMKGLFSAAKKNAIPVFEFQHGSISDAQVIYSYPENIHSNNEALFLPNTFLTFSPLWNKSVHFPVQRIHSVGNEFFYSDPIVSKRKNILIISTRMHHEDLISISKELSITYPNRKIFYKLHPTDFYRKNFFERMFSECKNIKITAEETHLKSLFSKCFFVVIIQSTVVFEAIQAGKEVLIYKRSNYKQDSFIFKYVNLFDSIHELRKVIDSHTKKTKHYKSPPIFFDKFDPIAFKRAIGVIKKSDSI